MIIDGARSRAGVSFREFWDYEGLPETRYELFSGKSWR